MLAICKHGAMCHLPTMTKSTPRLARPNEKPAPNSERVMVGNDVLQVGSLDLRYGRTTALLHDSGEPLRTISSHCPGWSVTSSDVPGNPSMDGTTVTSVTGLSAPCRWTTDVLTAYSRGRPPFAPLVRAALALAGVEMRPRAAAAWDGVVMVYSVIWMRLDGIYRE